MCDFRNKKNKPESHTNILFSNSVQIFVYFSLAANEYQMEDAQLAIERYIMSRIYTHAMFPNGDGDIMRDQYVGKYVLIEKKIFLS